MMMPSIFGENLFDDDWMDFPFDRFDREFFGRKNPLYGKHAKNMMKTDIRNTTKVMNWTWTCLDSRKMRSAYS